MLERVKRIDIPVCFSARLYIAYVFVIHMLEKIDRISCCLIEVLSQLLFDKKEFVLNLFDKA
jgi:hypothetical protein